MNFIDSNQIEDEEKKISKIEWLEPNISQIPYNALGGRNFEILVYRLFEKNIPDVYKDKEVKIYLMEGVGDQGRDISFVLNGHVDGVAQCKNWKTTFSKNLLIKEIIKTSLFMKQEGVLQFFNNYWIVAPEGCPSDAKSLIQNFSSLIKQEKIENLFNQVVEEYESFKGMTFVNEEKDLLSLLGRLQVTEITRIDLDFLLKKSPNVKRMHFKIDSIIDCETNKKMIEEALESFGLRMFTDVDLNILKENIEKFQKIIELDYLDLTYLAYLKKCLERLLMMNVIFCNPQ